MSSHYSGTSRISSIYPNHDGVLLRHENYDHSVGSFILEKNHPNYAAMYSLAYTAGINRLPIKIRTEDDKKTIIYMTLKF